MATSSSITHHVTKLCSHPISIQFNIFWDVVEQGIDTMDMQPENLQQLCDATHNS